MQGHKFEDNVNKQMEDLALRPTEGVWNRVEVALRKDRKRRRLFFVLPLFMAIAVGSYWWIRQPGKQMVSITDKSEINATRSLPNNSNEITSQPGIAKQNQSNNSNKETPDNINSILISPGNSIKTSAGNIPPGSEIDNHETGIKTNRKTRSIKPLSLVVSSKSFSQKIRKADPSVRPVTPLINYSILESGGGEIKPKEKEAVSEKQLSLRNQLSADPEKMITVEDKKDSMVTAMKQPITNSMSGIEKTKDIQITSTPKWKWQWGISANAGISRVVQGGLINAFEKSLVMDAAAYSGAVQTPGSPVNSEPAIINAGLNWSAGIFVQRKLGHRLQLSAGLQYNYFSASNSIGSRIDSTRIINNGTSNSLRVEGFYRNGTDGNYTSNYHFMELPVTLHVQLNKTKRTPFYWNSGLSVGRLLTTNALHYDGSSGFYYKDNNLFRRTQLAFHTGLSIKLFSQSKHPLEMGPQLHYKLSSLLHSNNDDQRHLLSGGIYMRWFLKK